MTTKTRAAKAFAEQYGNYNATDGQYRLVSSRLPEVRSATPSGAYDKALAGVTKDERDYWRSTADKAIADLKAVMRYLGLDDVYKDDTEVTYSLYSGGAYDRVTKSALTKFREDIRAVDQAADVTAAHERLTGGSL